MLDTTPKGASTPSYTVTDFQIFEVSLCPIGADQTAVTRTEPEINFVECEIVSAQSEGKKQMNQDKVERLRALEIENRVRSASLDESVAADMIARSISIEDASSEIFKKLEEQTTKGQKRSIAGFE